MGSGRWRQSINPFESSVAGKVQEQDSAPAPLCASHFLFGLPGLYVPSMPSLVISTVLSTLPLPEPIPTGAGFNGIFQPLFWSHMWSRQYSQRGRTREADTKFLLSRCCIYRQPFFKSMSSRLFQQAMTVISFRTTFLKDRTTITPSVVILLATMTCSALLK